jgi:mycofactocin biosynthetic radical S-adenosylmethionine protein MftC
VRALFQLIPQPFGSLVFERRTGHYLPFDREATALLIELVAQPIDRVMEKRGGCSEDVADFYERFYERGLFGLDGRFAGEVVAGYPTDERLVGPLAVHLEVTTACNLNCRHCFAGKRENSGPPLAVAELEPLFAELARLGSHRLGLTGGEPLLRHDLFEIVDSALAHGLSPCVTTNGMLLDERTAREFGRRDFLWLNVSLEGASPLTNDPIRGRGSFRRVVDNLGILSRHARFSLAFTITRSNMREVRECVVLARTVGAQSAVFRPLYPVGTAVDHPELMPTFAEYGEALRLIADMTEHEEGDSPCGQTAFSPSQREPARATIYSATGCGAGNTVCSISSTGDVSSCSFLGAGFVVGNIRERSLIDMWRDPRMRRFHAEGEPRRVDSPRFANGCRARALWLNGAADAADPWLAGGAAEPAGHATHPDCIYERELGPHT